MATLREELATYGATAAAREICRSYGIRDVERLRGRDRRKSVSNARLELMAWFRARVPELSLAEIGAVFGRDGSTISAATRKVRGALGGGEFPGAAPGVEIRHAVARDGG